jgi:hypothetical protein
MLRYAPRADAVRTLRLAAIAQQTPPERCAISADFAEIARPIRRIISEFNIRISENTVFFGNGFPSARVILSRPTCISGGKYFS